MADLTLLVLLAPACIAFAAGFAMGWWSRAQSDEPTPPPPPRPAFTQPSHVRVLGERRAA